MQKSHRAVVPIMAIVYIITVLVITVDIDQLLGLLPSV
jgi:Na+/alanine symporter